MEYCAKMVRIGEKTRKMQEDAGLGHFFCMAQWRLSWHNP